LQSLEEKQVDGVVLVVRVSTTAS